MFSLRLLFSLLMLLGIVLTVTFSSILSSRDAMHEVEELFDAQMVQTAKVLEQFYVNQLTEEELEQLVKRPILFHVADSNIETFAEQANPITLSYEHKLSFQLLSTTGQILAYSDSSGEQTLTHFTQGYDTRYIGSDLWHVYSFFSQPHQVWIVTAQRDDVRQELVSLIVRNTWHSPLIITPIMMFVMLLLTYFLFKPLKLLERHLDKRPAQDLTPINFKLPSELAAVQKALNSYLLRIADTMMRERRFSADAAHELKTPLAIIKLHSDGLVDVLSAQNKDVQQISLPYIDAIGEGVNRINHTVEQLLLLSRVDALEVLNRSDCKLQSLVDNVINQLLHIIADYEWSIDIPADMTINADPFYLELVLKNIIENACKYSPVESLITINAFNNGSHSYIEVIDQGCGMTTEEIALAKNRFYRADETTAQGAGLGLSICQHIMSLHQGELCFERVDPHGLKVTLQL
ncbi:two-component sensor histidine kinase [Shewanella inventionis]|uniref:histidine kinase n=1 Tax=Shewanella inventionis TaxID=1738770 RepID=A0ABQ1IS00_9GAMM|nr:ATP-binding protein [Shewanella inventionis]MCL1156676.1 ATP-binding protein [Shewanella inventionis]UAL44889.1 two-component sensor histidine kinase [Shewanella inventionis]GGB50506.1 two-component sensor histidine kinase [Shewanella inventionis]